MSVADADETAAGASPRRSVTASPGVNPGRVTRGSRVVTRAGRGVGAVVGAQPGFLVVARGVLFPEFLYIPLADVQEMAPGMVVVSVDYPVGAWGQPPAASTELPWRSGSSPASAVAPTRTEAFGTAGGAIIDAASGADVDAGPDLAAEQVAAAPGPATDETVETGDRVDDAAADPLLAPPTKHPATKNDTTPGE